MLPHLGQGLSVEVAEHLKHWFPSVYQACYSDKNAEDDNEYIKNIMVQFKFFLFQNEMEKRR